MNTKQTHTIGIKVDYLPPTLIFSIPLKPSTLLSDPNKGARVGNIE